MKRFNRSTALIFMLYGTAHAHFLVLLPSTDIIDSSGPKELTIDVRFAHPFEQNLMDMELPKGFGVLTGGNKEDLLERVKTVKHGDSRTYSANYPVSKPGDYIFFVEPKPYWEPAEGKFIVHLTKLIVNAHGVEESWDEPLGLTTEIVPLTRPYGLWTGNLFTGQVLLEDKPVPYAKIEVTYENTDSRLSAPSASHTLQVLKADANGVFSYAMPRAGWWGFAALSEVSKGLKGSDGRIYPVELGALIWVHAVDIK